jgi:hypothetical protein
MGAISLMSVSLPFMLADLWYAMDSGDSAGWKNGVSIGPGATLLTEIPRGPNSFAAARVKRSTGALLPA